jgi:hypothetical protein
LYTVSSLRGKEANSFPSTLTTTFAPFLEKREIPVSMTAEANTKQIMRIRSFLLNSSFLFTKNLSKEIISY